MEPKAELLDLPRDYGTPKKTLDWASVRDRLERALQYWVATTRPDGRPHVIPIDGIWLDDVWYYGGSPKTVRHHNLEGNASAVMHLDDPMKAVIVEGECRAVSASPDLAQRLAAASQKYAALGYSMDADSYSGEGLWALHPRRVLAWTNYPRDATRFTFP